ncbi:MAG: hypothetical protein ACOYLO_06275, partial [Ferruginibacter sp.]
MFKNIIIPDFFKKNLYLLVAAAWLITLSFLINNYWFSYSNLTSVQRKMTGYVNKAEKDFSEFTKDSLVNKLFLNKGISATQS